MRRAKMSRAIAQRGAVNTAGEMVLGEHPALSELPKNIQIVFIFHKIGSGWWPITRRRDKKTEKHKIRRPIPGRRYVFNISIPQSVIESENKRNNTVYFLQQFCMGDTAAQKCLYSWLYIVSSCFHRGPWRESWLKNRSEFHGFLK